MPTISDSLRQAHPDAPWLWREDWASGRMKSAQGFVAAVASLFALTFSGVSIPLLMKMREIFHSEGAGIALVAGLFPVAALGLCYWAITATRTWLRFRDAQLEITTIPGVVGGRFTGTAHIGCAVDSENGFTTRLSCLRRTRRGNKSRESIVWQQELVVQRSHLRRGAFGTAVPLQFEIPFESEPTSSDPTETPSIQWRLEVHGDLPGADFNAVFDVPIFKTEDSSEAFSERFEISGENAPRSPAPQTGVNTSELEDSRIAIGRGHDGSVEIGLPASRNRGGALFLTAFALIWNGFLYAAGRELPGLFQLALAPFWLVGGLLALLVPVAWLQSTQLHARPGEISVHRKMLGMGSPRVFPIADIKAILPVAQGGNGGKTNWSVKLQLKTKKKPRAMVQNLSSKADAQNIAAMLMEAITR